MLHSNIQQKVKEFFEEIEMDKHHRLRSWEYCYEFFRKSPTDIDKACLHLGFYLASWGMYRGSGFLLHKDYLIHEDLVTELLSPQYNLIKNITADDLPLTEKSDKVEAIFSLKEEIKKHYKRKNIFVFRKGTKTEASVTDTVITKILMGTLGCTPAYDRFFISGLEKENIEFTSFTPLHFSRMTEFCEKHKSSFREAKNYHRHASIEYPIMKIIDMYFWKLGGGK